MASEFVVEAIMSLPEVATVSQQTKMNWPWEWDGEKPVLPSEDDDDDDQERPRDPVYLLRVRGTSDLELVYEIVQPNDSVDVLSVGLRREIGLVRLAGDDRNDRDLRLVQESGLDRLLADNGLRSRLAKQLATEDVKGHLKDEAHTALSDLETSFAMRALPTKLGLGITGGPGISVVSLYDLDGVRHAALSTVASAQPRSDGKPRSPRRGETWYGPNPVWPFDGVGFSESRVVTHGTTRGQRQAWCRACRSGVALTDGTPSVDVEPDPARFALALRAVAEGHALRATAPILQVDQDPVGTWLDRAADHGRLVMRACLATAARQSVPGGRTGERCADERRAAPVGDHLPRHVWRCLGLGGRGPSVAAGRGGCRRPARHQRQPIGCGSGSRRSPRT